MLALRYHGWSCTSLAFLYACDRTSIEAQCRKYHVEPQQKVLTIERIIVQIIRPMTDTRWKVVDGERINRGKMYADYLKSNIPIEKNTIKGKI